MFQSRPDINDPTGSIKSDDEFERNRIVQGFEKRLSEERPILFDLFYINSGLVENELPFLCPSYLLLDVDKVTKYIGQRYSRQVIDDEVRICVSLIRPFVSANQYWYYLDIFLQGYLNPLPSNHTIEAYKPEIESIIERCTFSQLEAVGITIENQIDIDIDQNKEFFRYLHYKIQGLISRAFLEEFHETLISRIRKELPRQIISDLPEKDTNFMTKMQKKYRIRILQQNNGRQIINRVAKIFFFPHYRIQQEFASKKVISNNELGNTQFWGDEEMPFCDRIDIPFKNHIGTVLPDYEAKVYYGHDWNEHNRKIFTPDNPPPKIVRGYKFRIFFGKLFNKGNTPRFRVDNNIIGGAKQDQDSQYKYTALIIESGPPYLPIVFRIVDKKWDTYRTDGYTSTFLNGIYDLQIHFEASLFFQGYLAKELY